MEWLWRGVERSFGWLVHWGGLLREPAGRLDVSAAPRCRELNRLKQALRLRQFWTCVIGFIGSNPVQPELKRRHVHGGSPWSQIPIMNGLNN